MEQLTHVAKERGHQQRQEEMQEELRRCSDVIASLQERLTQAQQHEVTIAGQSSSAHKTSSQ
jgi:hypothetical protein